MNTEIPIENLPSWLQELWRIDSNLARQAEKDYTELVSKTKELEGKLKEIELR